MVWPSHIQSFHWSLSKHVAGDPDCDVGLCLALAWCEHLGWASSNGPFPLPPCFCHLLSLSCQCGESETKCELQIQQLRAQHAMVPRTLLQNDSSTSSDLRVRVHLIGSTKRTNRQHTTCKIHKFEETMHLPAPLVLTSYRFAKNWTTFFPP